MKWLVPGRNIYQRIVDKGLPMRHRRWCCKEYKESTGDQAGRTVVTGVRWAESIRRRDRRQVEACHRNGERRLVHPILSWSTAQVWEFIREQGLKVCCLYSEGWKRVGCVLCPFSNRVEEERRRFPAQYKAYRRAALAYYARKKAEDPTWGTWEDGEAMFQWWLDRRRKDTREAEGQCGLFDDEGNE